MKIPSADVLRAVREALDAGDAQGLRAILNSSKVCIFSKSSTLHAKFFLYTPRLTLNRYLKGNGAEVSFSQPQKLQGVQSSKAWGLHVLGSPSFFWVEGILDSIYVRSLTIHTEESESFDLQKPSVPDSPSGVSDMPM